MTDAEIQEMSKAEINRIFRQNDESHLWPIKGKFNVTERAIRKTRKLFPELQGLEYYLALEQASSRIVNDESNW